MTVTAATDPNVLGQQRLFSAWIEGQIAYRGLPGIVVGVVADQELVWAQGFGFADVAAKKPMTPQTAFRMASHSKLFTATSINERLVIMTPNGANLETPTELVPLGGGRFRYTARTGGGEVGEVVRFVEENGRVVRMVTGDSYVDRLPDLR